MTPRKKGPLRKCSECNKRLPNANQRTCSDSHRQLRARRKKREAQAHAIKIAEAKDLPEHLKALSDANNKLVKDVGRDLVVKQMTPVIREAITEDVMQGIRDMVRLTPRMVALIEEDMESRDPQIRQKAYTLLARYTLGNASVAPAPAEVAPAPMQVSFVLPRPGDACLNGDVAQDVQHVDLRTCAQCNQDKPAGEFVGDSDRCQGCHDALQAKVQEQFGG